MYVSKDTLGLGAILLILLFTGVSLSAIVNHLTEEQEDDDRQDGQQHPRR